jgi:4-amino-4-deoxy-L-arabinose transferase-like glycosyltransferase
MTTSHNAPPLRYLLTALALYSLLQILFLGLAPISGSSEAREAQVIDTILREGEWILPLRNGIVPSKPPLFHWIGASISSLLGEVSELTVRLPSHIAAVGILLLSGLVAFRVARFSQTVEGELHQERVALLAPAILSLTYGFHQMASQAMVDMIFSLCLWCALASLMWSEPREWLEHRRITWQSRALFWFSCAIAMVARGPVGVALPVVLVGITGWYLAGFKSTLREMARPSVGWLAFLIPCGWYYAAYLKGGEAFLARQLLFENVRRFVGGEKVNTEVWWFYVPSLLRTTAPWGALMLLGFLRYAWKAGGLSYLGGFKRWAIAPTISLVAGVFLFSLSSGKRHSYMLPLQPLIAIQCALLFSMFLERRGLPTRERLWRVARRLEGFVAFIIVLLLTGAGVAHQFDWGHHPLEEIIKFACAPFTFRAGLVVLFLLGVMGLLKREHARPPYGRLWFLIILLMTLCVAAGNVVKGTLRSWPIMTEQLLLTVKGGQRIAVIKEPFDEYFDPIFFYARRPIAILSATEGIDRCDPNTVYVAKRSWLLNNPELVPGDVRILTTLREIKRAFEGSKGEDIDVFTCARRVDGGRAVSEGLRDACANGIQAPLNFRRAHSIKQSRVRVVRRTC